MAMLNHQRVHTNKPIKQHGISELMWEKPCHKPPIWNGHHTTQFMVMTGGWFIIWLVVLTILEHMKVNRKGYPIYYGK